jgi:BRCT domain type II-containing protein
LKNIKIKNITEEYFLKKINDMQDTLDSYEETDKEGVEKITDKSKDLKDNIF